MFWTILILLFMIYVVYSLSKIKHQLELISKHLKLDDGEIVQMSDEEIEKELEEYLK